MRVSDYNPKMMVGDLRDKVIVITGGTGGIGRETVLELARHNPRQIVFTGRNEASAKGVTQAVGDEQASFVACDLMSLESVRAAACAIRDKYERIDILIANAGISTASSSTQMTVDGFEPIWGVDHVAHALFIRLLLPNLGRNAAAGRDTRVVLLSSILHRQIAATGIDYDSTRLLVDYGRGRTDIRRYGQAKFANLLYGQELARRYPGILSLSIHPGLVMTEMNTKAHWFARTLMTIFVPFNRLKPAEGAYTSLWAATADRSSMMSGGYYEPVGEAKVPHKAATREAGRALWDWTEEAIAKWLS